MLTVPHSLSDCNTTRDSGPALLRAVWLFPVGCLLKHTYFPRLRASLGQIPDLKGLCDVTMVSCRHFRSADVRARDICLRETVASSDRKTFDFSNCLQWAVSHSSLCPHHSPQPGSFSRISHRNTPKGHKPR